MDYNDDMKQKISDEATGKVVRSLHYEQEGGYWVMEFTDDGEISFRFMAELEN